MSLSVLIAVTHLLGVGHLARAAAIGRALAARGHRVTLASGGMPAPLVSTTGLRWVQLPPVRTRIGDFRTLLDAEGQPVRPDHLGRRRAMLAREIDRARPDVFVTELFPFGRRILAEEFLGAIAGVEELRPDAAILCSIRDILVAPARPDRIAETHARLRDSYDAVLVHGDAEFVSLAASWPLEPGLGGLVRYTGYVDSAEPAGAPAATMPEPGIVVSGGGSAAGMPLFRAAIEAAALIPDIPWLVLAGGGIDEASLQALRAVAPSAMRIERARADFRPLLAAAALSVSQAGYNTVIAILASGVRAVLVPFEEGQESEQRIRASLLAERGRALLLAQADLSGPTLAAAIRTALASPGFTGTAPAFDGATESARMIESIAAAKRVAAPALRPSRGGGWSALARSLDLAADAGVTLPFWWRDDDAVAATPELDRLIGLARRFDWPLALAAIPACAEASLAERIADEPLIGILVHGWSHADHAARGSKKAEFGPDRPLADARAEAGRALSRARALFGDKLSPVFVPPWNRVAPAVAGALPSLGYRALSTFASTSIPRGPSSITCIDTHVDPIAWRGSRGLADPDHMLRSLAAQIAERVERGDAEPIGLLTHHLVSPEAVWRFCEELIAAIAGHRAARIQAIGQLIAAPPQRHRSLMAIGDDDGLDRVAEG